MEWFKEIIWTPLCRWFDRRRLSFDRHLAEGSMRQILMVVLLCLVFTVACAVVLLCVYGAVVLAEVWPGPAYGGEFKPHNVLDAAYYLLFNNGGQNLFGGSHWIGLGITTAGIVLIALLTSTMTAHLERRTQRYLSGESWYRMKGHTVIFGASDYLYSIISETSRLHPEREFLIMTTQDVASVRREVFSFLGRAQEKKIVFYFGDRTSQEDISRLSLEGACDVFIIGDMKEGDDIESYRDANNMDCVAEIGKYLESKGRGIRFERRREEGEKNIDYIQAVPGHRPPLDCHVVFEYQTSFSAFQFSEVPFELKRQVNFLPFNYYDLWADKVLLSGHAGPLEDGSYRYQYKFLDSLEGKGLPGYIKKDSPQTVHLIILGMSKMGIALGLRAAFSCHYPNFDSSDKKTAVKRTRITFIDANADIEMNYMKGRFPALFSELSMRYLDMMDGGCAAGCTRLQQCGWKGDEKGGYDIEMEFIKGRIESEPVQTFIEQAAAAEDHIVTIASCLVRSHLSMAVALYMRESVYQNCLQVLVFQRRSGTIVRDLAETELADVKYDSKARYRKLVPFGMLDEGYDPALCDDKRARLVSYIYDSYYALKRDGSLAEFKRCDIALSCYKDPYRFWSDERLLDKKDRTPEGEEETQYIEYPTYRGAWGQKFVMDRMSSAYNAASIPSKLRAIGCLEENDCPPVFSKEQVLILQRMEHNRWNIEKMLTGYRPLTEGELDEMKHLWDKFKKLTPEERKKNPDYKVWKKRRSQLKSWPTRAHLDICTFEELKDREEDYIIALDRHLVDAIPHILATTKDEQTE